MIIKINLEIVFLLGIPLFIIAVIGTFLNMNTPRFWWFFGLIIIADLMLWAKSIVKWWKR